MYQLRAALTGITVADVVNRSTRSRMMASIRATNTKPELRLRQALHRLGFRFRLHDKRLPGTPDLVLRRHRAVIFVHGCFWHRHEGCHWCTTPSSNVPFWTKKFAGNIARDRVRRDALRQAGWRVATVWECALRGHEGERTVSDLSRWLRSDKAEYQSPLVRERAHGPIGAYRQIRDAPHDAS